MRPPGAADPALCDLCGRPSRGAPAREAEAPEAEQHHRPGGRLRNGGDRMAGDTGLGIASPYSLFKPFQLGANATGLGLYVSRAILRTFGGELNFEPRSQGCCFAVNLATVADWKGSHDE